MTDTVVQSEIEQVEQDVVDFKMVTFSLGGKDYGIDIMRVKEIAKFIEFTYVPNTAHYVRGVYNLRGDIISVVDLRAFFNIPAEKTEEGRPDNGLILRFESNLLGVIVDSIDKVVGISSKRVQPPHPIFGDINIKYISGVADYDGNLYIILDVDRIFRRDDESGKGPDTMARRRVERAEVTASDVPVTQREQTDGSDGIEGSVEETALTFIADGVQTFSDFYLTSINHRWFTGRVKEWLNRRLEQGKEYQLQEKADADAFLSPFLSRFTGTLWRDQYAEEFGRNVPATESTMYNVWNPGCGSGQESYSIAAILKRRFPNRQIKIWAGDKDLLPISSAPNLVFHEAEIPDGWEDFMVKGKNGLTFHSEIKEMILFEFSDILSVSALPKMDIIVARDILSFQRKEDQERIIERFDEVLKPGGILVVGDNEEISDSKTWKPVEAHPVKMYIHR